jgi:hypothetical protein
MKIVPFLPLLLILLIVVLAVRIYKRKSHSVFEYVIAGGLFFGFVGLFAGMLTSVIIAPKNNLLPIIGIFYTGPAGFLIGLFAGWYYESKRKALANKE